MVAIEQQPLTRSPENAVANGIGVIKSETGEELQKGFSSKKAKEYLGLDSQGLKGHWEEFLGEIRKKLGNDTPLLEVPTCPEFIQEFKRHQEVIIVDGKERVISGRIPLLVPKIPAEQLALALGENIKAYTNGAWLEKEKHREWEWMLTDASFAPSYLGATEAEIENFLGIRSIPGARKLDENDPIPVDLVPVGFGMGAYIMRRKYFKWIADEFPDQGIWSRLANARVGSYSNPPIRAVGEGLETKTGWVNYSAPDVGWPVGLIAKQKVNTN